MGCGVSVMNKMLFQRKWPSAKGKWNGKGKLLLFFYALALCTVSVCCNANERGHYLPKVGGVLFSSVAMTLVENVLVEREKTGSQERFDSSAGLAAVVPGMLEWRFTSAPAGFSSSSLAAKF